VQIAGRLERLTLWELPRLGEPIHHSARHVISLARPLQHVVRTDLERDDARRHRDLTEPAAAGVEHAPRARDRRETGQTPAAGRTGQVRLASPDLSRRRHEHRGVRGEELGIHRARETRVRLGPCQP
jgi:hypothetical protein